MTERGCFIILNKAGADKPDMKNLEKIDKVAHWLSMFCNQLRMEGFFMINILLEGYNVVVQWLYDELKI